MKRWRRWGEKKRELSGWVSKAEMLEVTKSSPAVALYTALVERKGLVDSKGLAGCKSLTGSKTQFDEAVNGFGQLPRYRQRGHVTHNAAFI